MNTTQIIADALEGYEVPPEDATERDREIAREAYESRARVVAQALRQAGLLLR